MKLVHTKHPDTFQLSDIRNLTESCHSYDRIRLSVPSDGNDYFLLYDNQELLSVLSLFFSEKTLCECSAFTLPQKRRNGLFRSLFDAAIKELEQYETRQSCEIDLCFPVDISCKDTIAVLGILEAEFWYSEHLMSYQLDQLHIRQPCCASGGQKLSIQLRKKSEAEYQLIAKNKKPQLLGTCFLDICDDSAYFYGFQIEEKLRGQGIGFLCLQKLLTELKSAGIQKVSLQVSGQNLPALSLYKKTGFQIKETLSYYLY